MKHKQIEKLEDKIEYSSDLLIEKTFVNLEVVEKNSWTERSLDLII